MPSTKVEISELTEPELKVVAAMKRLQKKHGWPKILSSAEIEAESGYSQPRVSQIMQLLEAKGAYREELHILV